jgi:DNA polymerase-3 subunit alpha
MEYVPLNLNTKDGAISTQYIMTTCEELGLLKMDFLGLRTLTVIQDAFKEIERLHGKKFDGNTIPYDDEAVFKLISSGKTLGVFQLESPGMRSFMKELQPGSIEDIIAGISLYRPGPMDFIPKYIEGKRNPEKITYTHPRLEPILKTTYGCIVYQEQVMQIVQELAGYSLGRSDMVRRAMSKKKTDVMAKERESFINGTDGVPGCIANGIDADIANKIFDEMTDFAKYAFNKSHAAAYAVVAYQTAWLKAHYPVEFMASLMTSVMDRTDKIAEYIEDCKSMGIKTLPPDVNEGYGRFSVSNGCIRYALSAIKSVGAGNIEALVAERERKGKYISLTQFISRLNADLNSRCIESLILAGAFDSLGGKRAQYMQAYKGIYEGAVHQRRNTLQGQMSLFDMAGASQEETYRDILPNVAEYPNKEKLSYEKELIGIYISGHPLNDYMDTIKKNITHTTKDFPFNPEDFSDPYKLKDGMRVEVGGIIVAMTVKYTKKNQQMAFVTIEDLYRQLEIIFFPDSFAKYRDILKEENVIIVSGRTTISEDQGSKLICEQAMSCDELAEDNKTLWLKIPTESEITPDDVVEILTGFKGRTKVIIYLEKEKKKLVCNSNLRVNSADEKLIETLKTKLGEKSVVLK